MYTCAVLCSRVCNIGCMIITANGAFGVLQSCSACQITLWSWRHKQWYLQWCLQLKIQYWAQTTTYSTCHKKVYVYGCSDACWLTHVPAICFWRYALCMSVFASSVCLYVPRMLLQAHLYIGKLRPRYTHVWLDAVLTYFASMYVRT